MTALSDATLRALRHADQVIHEAARADVFAVYDACRAAVGAIAPVDDFYVALVNEADRRICYPYVFSNGAYLEGGALTYGPSGVVAWVLASQRPYRYTDDQGALLNRGVRFGDEELSADAIVVPMIGAEGEGLVVGIVGALSDTPGAFTDETVVAMQWLATLVLDRVHASHPSRRLNLGLVYPELDDAGRSEALTAVNSIASALTSMARELAELGETGSGSTAADSAERLSSLSRRCFEIQAMLVTRVGPPSVESSCALAAPGGARTGARRPNRRTEAGRWSDVRGDHDRSAVRSVTSAHGLWRAGLLGGTVRP